MKWINALLAAVGLVVGLSFTSRADELQPLTVRDFSPGLATENDPSIICDGCAQDLINVDVENGSIEKRRGSVRVSSAALGGFTSQANKLIHWFDDQNAVSWLITHSSNTLFKSSNGGVSNSILTSTHGVTADNLFCAVNAFGKARLTDGTTSWILWDGTSVTTSTSSPMGKTCEFFAERIWTSVGSFLQASNNGDPEDWTQDSNTDDDAFFTYIRQNDGYSIRALKRFKNGLLIFKDYSTDYLVMNQDGLTFTNLPISSRVGTQHSKSVVERENDVVWMAHDGYYSYDGSVLRRISDPIGPTFNQILQLSVGEQTYTETSQSQFQAGTNTQTSPSILSGSVVLSTWTGSDDSTSDFNSFASSSNVRIADNKVYLSTNNTNVDNNGIETGSPGACPTGWTCVGSAAIATSIVHGGAQSLGVQVGSSSDPLYLFVADSNGSLFIDQTDSISTNTTSGTMAQFTYTAAQMASAGLQTGRWVKLGFGNVGGTAYAVAPLCLYSGSDLTFWAARSVTSILVDDIGGACSTISSGSLTSRAFDTSVTNSVWLTSTATYVTNNHSITFETQSSSDSTNWTTAASWTSASAPTSAANRYIRYSVAITTGGTTNGVGLPYLDTVSLAARSGSGRYLSSAVDTSGGTSWNPFIGISDTSGGGTATFEIYQDTNTSITPTDASTFISSQTVTNGATPSLSFSSYTFVGTTFTASAAANNPALDEFTVSWNEGGGGNFPVWSTYYQGSYISAVALSSATGNDRMLVYDQNGSWTLYSYPAYSLGIYKQKPYFGSNLQGDIVRFQADGIFNDYTGSAISSYWVSKDFDFGYPLTDKTITRYYLTAAYTLSSDVLFEWGTNRGSLTSESPLGLLDLDSTAGFFRKSINPSSLTYKRGLSHRFKFSDSDTDNFFKILSFTIRANLETAP